MSHLVTHLVIVSVSLSLSSITTICAICAFCGRSSGLVSTNNAIRRVGASSVVLYSSSIDSTLGADVVLSFGSFLLVLVHGDAICAIRWRVDDHDHALLAVLGLRAVDIHWLGIGDRDHEHRRVAGLAIVVPIAFPVLSVSVPLWGWSGNWLEVREDGVSLRLAGTVGVR